MKDDYISRSAAFALLLWVTAFVLVICTWAIAIVHVPTTWTAATTVTAVFAMAGAVICQMRLYVSRLSRLIRVTNGLSAPDAELAHIGPRGQRPG